MYKNQYSVGYRTVTHKNKRIAVACGSNKFEQYYTTLDFSNYRIGIVPAGYQNRPDLISNVFFGSPFFDWLICYINNIKDPFNELNSGDRILLPTKI